MGTECISLCVGPMCSGKSTRCIIEYNVLKDVHGYRCILFSPTVDTKNKNLVISRNKLKLEVNQVKKLCDNIEKVKEYDYVFVDEAQFFDGEDVINFIDFLRQNSIGANFYGLNFDFMRNKWPTIEEIDNRADKKEELKSICTICKKKTRFTYRVNGGKEKIMVDGEATYEPRCLKHFKFIPE